VFQVFTFAFQKTCLEKGTLGGGACLEMNTGYYLNKGPGYTLGNVRGRYVSGTRNAYALCRLCVCVCVCVCEWCVGGGAEVGVWTVLERMSEMRMGLPLSVAVTMRCRNRLHPLKLFVPLFDMPLKERTCRVP
jgi:hypothetical protein